MLQAANKGRRFFYGWVVGVSGLVFAVVRGVNDSFGVFFVAILEEFGWSRAAVAIVCAWLAGRWGRVQMGRDRARLRLPENG